MTSLIFSQWLIPIWFFLSVSMESSIGWGSVKKIRLGIFYGYNDQHPDAYVIDNFQKQSLIEDLTRDCHIAFGMICGFQMKISAQEVLLRTIGNTEIEIFVYSSSLTSYDPVNRSLEMRRAQQDLSMQVQNLFFNSLRHLDATFYIGHARYGAGPDFSYLPTDKIGKKVRSSDFAQIKKVLANAKLNPLKADLFLLACDSELHWQKVIRSSRPLFSVYALKSIIKPKDVDLLTRQLLNHSLYKFLSSSNVPKWPPGVVRL